MKKILVDTNLLLDDANILFKLKEDYDVVVLSVVVLKELDKHKFNPDLSYSARTAINSILEFRNIYPNNIEFIINDTDMSNNDSLIIDAAKISNSVLATKDISMSLVAENIGINTRLYGNIANGIYDPYLELSDLDFPGNFSYNNIYTGIEYSELFSLAIFDTCDINSWFFVFIRESCNKLIAIYANNPVNHTFVRIDNNPSYRIISNSDIKFKAKDEYQICAIYALENADNVLITGKWGSGKSLLTSAYAIVNNSKKTFISRAPIGIDHKLNIGFLPGSKNDKLNPYVMGFLSSLYFLYGNTKLHEKEGAKFDYVKEQVFPSVFELIDINSVQGLSLLDDILICDEVQLLSIDIMSAVLSRATDKSKIILTGDLKQSYGVKPSNSGLLKLLRSLPHTSMAYVELKNSYRSNLLELAEKLQDKTF